MTTMAATAVLDGFFMLISGFEYDMSSTFALRAWVGSWDVRLRGWRRFGGTAFAFIHERRLAEREGFEPPGPFPSQRFSRPPP